MKSKPAKSSSRKMNNAPAKAIVLAAGLGERMRPLTSSTPKAMMPFAGRPIIHHTLSNLQAWGVSDVLINLHHAPAPLVNYLQTTPFPDLKISLSFEPDICGTGGALRRAAWFIDNQPFWLVNSDVVFEMNPAGMLKQFSASKPLACLWLTKSGGPRTVQVYHDRITCFSSKHPGTNSTATFSGIHLLSPAILKYLPDRPYSSIIEAYNTALKKNAVIIAAEDASSYWADIGNPEKLLSTHIDLCKSPQKHLKLHETVRKHLSASKHILKNKGANVRGFASACPSLSISGTPVIENSILGQNITLGPSAVITNCIVGSSARVDSPVSRVALPLPEALDPMDIHALKTNRFEVDHLLAEALPPRGSDRSFFRLHAGRTSYILTKYKTVRTENARFTNHLRFLEKLGFPVPRLHLDLKNRNLCIVEDLGNSSIQNMFSKMGPAKLASLYSCVIDQMALLHNKGTYLARKTKYDMEAPFDDALYLWEHRLFAEHYLEGKLNLNPRKIAKIMKELSLIPGKLQRAPQVIIHRDLQSSNIMLKNGRPVFIDFQGMRLGSRFYDAASLIFDPYITLPGKLQHSLIAQYAAASGIPSSTAFRMTMIAGIQRLAQALGAYGRLSKIEGMRAFGEHIKPAERNMSYCLQAADFLPALSDIMQEQS